MEAISTSVPSINVPKIHLKTHNFHHLKPPLLLLHRPHISTSSTVSGKPPSSISNKPASSSHRRQLQSTSQPIPSHRTAATGYAAAMVDSALCSNSLDAIFKDVKRLLKWLHRNEMLKDMMGDPFVEEAVKGRVIKEVSDKGKLRRQVVAMVKMLVEKNKSGMVAQVMEEFERIYQELNNGLRAVVV